MLFSIENDREISPISEPTMCDCQNQLGHYDWSGAPLDDLPELCRKTMGLAPQNDKDEANTSVTESDPEWEHGKT